MQKKNKVYVSPKEASSMASEYGIDISTITVRKYVRLRNIGIKIGGRYYVRVNDFLNWIHKGSSARGGSNVSENGRSSKSRSRAS